MGTSERLQRAVVVESGSEALGWVAHLLNHGLQVAWVDFDEETPQQWLGYARRARPSWTFLPRAWDTVEVRRISRAHECFAEADLVLYAAPEPTWNPAWQASQSMLPSGGLLAVNSISGPWEPDLERIARLRAPKQLRSNKLLEVSGAVEGVGGRVSSLAESRLGRCTVGVKPGRPGVLQRLEVWLVNASLRIAERHMLPLELIEAATSVLYPDMKHGLFRPLREFDPTRHLLWTMEWDHDLTESEANHDPQPPRAIAWLANVQAQNRSLAEPFYRPGDREALVLDPITLAYREAVRVDDRALAGLQPAPAAERLRRLLESRNEAGTFLKDFFPRLVRLCERLALDLEDGADGLDRIVRWGLGWEAGPFELAAPLGLFERPPASDPVTGYEPAIWPISLDVPSDEGEVTVRQTGHDWVEIGWTHPDGVLDGETAERLRDAVCSCDSPRIALVGGSRSFCTGVDYLEWLRLATAKEYNRLERQLATLQELCDALSERPSVALVQGSARGFGMELALACRGAIVQAECDLGFDHVLWGIMPCGGGCTRLRARSWPHPKRVAELVLDLALGWVADNAVLGKALGILRDEDLVVMHPDGLKQALEEWDPPANAKPAWPALSPLVTGMVDSGQSRSVRIGEMTEYDSLMADRIKRVFRAGSREEALLRERQCALEALREGRTLARLRHMLDIERPLRN